MPLLCPDGFHSCTTRLAARERFRKNNTDGKLPCLPCLIRLPSDEYADRGFGTSDASPGYFALTLNNEIKMEATSTRRAGLERFTFPSGSKPYFVLDLANDLPASFAGGQMNFDPEAGRVTIGGLWEPR